MCHQLQLTYLSHHCVQTQLNAMTCSRKCKVGEMQWQSQHKRCFQQHQQFSCASEAEPLFQVYFLWLQIKFHLYLAFLFEHYGFKIQVVELISILLLFIANLDSVVYTFCCLLICLPVHRHLPFSQFGSTMNESAMNIHVNLCTNACFYFLVEGI